MKIKFIKDYAINRGACPLNIGGFDMLETEIVKADTVVDLEKDNGDGAFSDELIKWLIDNGFAEKVEDRWPREGDKYWLVDTDGNTVCIKWENDEQDDKLKAIGNVFKTEELARRFIDYLQAVEAVRHDEGFMKYNKTFGEVWELRRAYLDSEEFFSACKIECGGLHHLGAFYFDTEEHAIASSEKHHSEWETILNYNWGKGEDEEDED